MSGFVPVSGAQRWGNIGGRGYHRGQQGNRGRGRGRGRHRFGGRTGRGGGRGRRPIGNARSPQDYPIEIEEMGTHSDDSLCVAVQGCCHGALDEIYNVVREHEQKSSQKVDLLLCCGDFQSLRNTADYYSLAVPPKYRMLGSFHEYYSGEKVAPVLTIFIGGNHEASQPLQELYYGGWVAPKIYYLGAAGVVNVAGVRIGGISGIYKSHDYTLGRFERPLYDRSTLRSVYHVRNTDVYRLKCLSPNNRIDIMLSHDWPQGIEQRGDTADLLRRKPFFRDEVQRNELGSPPNHELLETLKPKWWFSAHLHVKFKARVDHAPPVSEASAQPMMLVPSQVHAGYPENEFNEKTVTSTDTDNKASQDPSTQDTTVTTDFHSLESSKQCGEPDLTDLMTQFLALDKCLPRRQHLSILHVPCKGRKDILEYDPEWLAILRKTHHLTRAEKRRVHCPRDIEGVTDDEVELVRTRLAERDGVETETAFDIPDNFEITASTHSSLQGDVGPLPMMGNPQTDELLGLLGLDHVITVPFASTSSNAQVLGSTPIEADANEIDLDADDDDLDDDTNKIDLNDDNEIDLDDSGDPSRESDIDNEIVLDYEGDTVSGEAVEGSTPATAVQVSKRARTNS